MWPYIIKILISAVTIVIVSELAKRNSLWAALLASLPLTSLLAFVWLYLETGDAAKVAALAANIVWLVLPSLLLFVLLPLLIRTGLGFWLSLLLASTATAAFYAILIKIITRLGIHEL